MLGPSRGLAIISLVLVLSLAPRFSLAHSKIDCGNTTTLSERTVCASPELLRLDARAAALFARVLSQVLDPNGWRDPNRNTRRNRCVTDAVCLKNFYNAEIKTHEGNLKLFAEAERAREREEQILGLLGPSFEDTAHLSAIVRRKDFTWFAHSRYIARIVQRVLRERGFEAKSASYIAATWASWRYHPETGARLYLGRASKLTSRDAINFAHALPECLKDASTSSCKFQVSIELGCRYNPQLAAMCQQNFEMHKPVFASLFDPDPRSNRKDSPYPFNQYNFYAMTNCGMDQGGRGADLVVFAPSDVKAATKLAFDAVQKAERVATASAPAKAMPPPSTKFCSEVGITESGYNGKYGGVAVQVPGRTAELYLDPSGPRGRLEQFITERHERNLPVPESVSRAAREFGISVP